MNSVETQIAAVLPDIFEDAGAPNPGMTLPDTISEGQRNMTLTQCAGAMRRRGFSVEAIEAALGIENRRLCLPPLADDEVRSIARSIGRYAPKMAEAEHEANSFAEQYSAFTSRIAGRPYPADLVPSLVPAMGITMVHGQPRSFKTWMMLEIARAMITADAAFGVESFRVTSPHRVWYLTEEDPELEIHARLARVFAGHHQHCQPDLLHVSVQKGISLSDRAWQDRLIAYALANAIDATIFDPIRSLSDAVDQGPDKLRPLALFLRRYTRETGSAVLLNHHDTKPLVGKQDDRAKPQRASGGGIFSIADSPIHCERVRTEARAILTPSFYKFSIAPDPFIVSIESDDPKRPTWVRVKGETTSATDASDIALHDRIIEYLHEYPSTSGSKLARALHVAKEQALTALDSLRQNGRADFLQRGQAHLWSVVKTEGAE